MANSTTPPKYAKQTTVSCQRYRAILAVIKAKLIAIDEGIATFESEFLDRTLIPGTNQTVGEWANQQLQQGYLTGNVPPLLPPGLS